MLTREEIDGERNVLFPLYRQITQRSAALALAELRLVIDEQQPTARWVGLATTDQDYSGAVIPMIAVDEAGELLTEELSDHVDMLDCDDQTCEVWGPPSEITIDARVWLTQHGPSRLAELKPGMFAGEEYVAGCEYILDVVKLRAFTDTLVHHEGIEVLR